jgi:hypothetical protein
METETPFPGQPPVITGLVSSVPGRDHRLLEAVLGRNCALAVIPAPLSNTSDHYWGGGSEVLLRTWLQFLAVRQMSRPHVAVDQATHKAALLDPDETEERIFVRWAKLMRLKPSPGSPVARHHLGKHYPAAARMEF